MKYLIGLMLFFGNSVGACEKCLQIEKEVLFKITSLVHEYNQDHDDVGIISQTMLVGRLQSYLEINDKFFKIDYASLNDAD